MYTWLIGLLLVLLAIVGLIYYFGTRNYNHFKQLNIPYTRPIPVLGNMGRVMVRKINFADMTKEFYCRFKNERMFGFYDMHIPMLFVKDPELIKMITVKDFEYFTNRATSTFFTEEVDPLFGRSLISLKDTRWKNMRSTLSPAFTSSKMKAMFLLVDECGKQMAQHLTNKCEAEPDGMVVLELKDFYTRFTNDVIATSAFGIHCDSLANPENEFYVMGKKATTFGMLNMLKFMLSSWFPKLMQLIGVQMIEKSITTFFRALVHGTIAAREKEGIVRPDMIHLLMQARKGTLTDDITHTPGTNKIELTDDDITAQAFLFFFAGFDTSSTLLCFMSMELAIHPEIQKRVQEEIDTIVAEYDGKLVYEGVQKMKYLDMVMSETLRLWPPAPSTDRLCVKPYLVSATPTSPSLQLNIGETIIIPTYALHRDPEHFPDPDRFDPERFSEENKHNINPFVYLPFGVGPRNCIGMRFAQMETKIAMAYLLSRFHLQVVDKTQLPLRLDPKSFGTTIVGGFWLGIKLRTPNCN